MTVVYWYELPLSSISVEIAPSTLIREIYRSGTTSFPCEIDGVVRFQSFDLIPVRQALAKLVAAAAADATTAAATAAAAADSPAAAAVTAAHDITIVEIGIAGIAAGAAGTAAGIAATSSQRCPNCASLVPNRLCPRCA
jgi:hypothetical protein